MKLHEAKKLLIETMKEKEGVHYALGWLANSYYYHQHDEAEKYLVTQTLAKYGVNVEIEL